MYDVTGGKVSHTFIILNWYTLYNYLETFYNYYSKDEKQNDISLLSVLTIAIIQINYMSYFRSILMFVYD